MAGEFFNCSFGNYEGKKRWTVMHPRHHREITVRAPDDNAAIQAAANYWGEDWTRYDFYAYCEVLKA